MPRIFVVGSYNTGLTIRVPRMPARAGAFTALRLGVINGLPTRVELENFALDN